MLPPNLVSGSRVLGTVADSAPRRGSYASRSPPALRPAARIPSTSA